MAAERVLALFWIANFPTHAADWKIANIMLPLNKAGRQNVGNFGQINHALTLRKHPDSLLKK